MFIPRGRVYIDESPAALEGKTEITKISVDIDSKPDIGLFKLTYCLAGNNYDPSVSDRRQPSLINRFSVWWKHGSQFIHEDQTWNELGVRDNDLFIVTTELPNGDTDQLAAFIEKQISFIDQDAQEDTIKRATSKAIQEHLGEKRLPSPTVNRQAFVAMPMNEKADPGLADTLDSIKGVFGEFDLKAVRVDDVQDNTQITDKIRSLIESSQYVIADLTDNRPNVFFEAGYAEGIGKTPIYIARDDTRLEFDVKDYPVIFFNNQISLKDGIRKRLNTLLNDGQTVAP